MTSPAVDVAYVDIVARVKEFRKDLKKVIDNEVKELDKELNGVLDEIDEHFKKTSSGARHAMKGIADATASTTETVGDLADVFDQLKDKIADTSDGFDEHFNASFKKFSDAWDEFDRRGPFRRALSGIGDLITDVGQRLLTAGGSITRGFGAVSQVLVPLSVALPPLIGLLVTLGAVVTDAAGALALLPGALAVLLAIIAPLVIGFNGFGEALGAVMSKDPKKLAEALKELAPAARSVVREFQKLQPIFTSIGDVVQQQLFAPLVGDLTQLVTVIRGPLLAGLANVASSLGNIISDFAALLSQPESVAALAAVFATTGQILETMRPAIVAIVAGFRDLVVASLPFLERFATFIAQVGESFGKWLSEVTRGEKFNEFMESALGSLQAIAQLAGAVLAFFGALFTPETIAGGQAILVLLTDVFGMMTEFLKSETGKRFLEDLALLALGAAGAISALVIALGFVFAAITLFVGEVARLFTGLDELLDGWSVKTKSVTDAVVGYVSAVPQRLEAFAAQFAAAGFSLIQSFVGGFRRAGNFINDVAGDIVGHIKNGLNKFISKINFGIGQLDAVLPFQLARIPQLAAGAVVGARPGGTLATIAEAGEDEAVAPLSTLEGMIADAVAANAGATAINFSPGAIQVNFDGAVPTTSEAYDVGQSVGDGIAGALARRGVQLRVRAV